MKIEPFHLLGREKCAGSKDSLRPIETALIFFHAGRAKHAHRVNQMPEPRREPVAGIVLHRLHLGRGAERAWAADWIVAILTREGVAITPEVKEHIWTALTTSLASAPVEERTITALAVLLQSNDLKQALRRHGIEA
jgi:hypothetical protein